MIQRICIGIAAVAMVLNCACHPEMSNGRATVRALIIRPSTPAHPHPFETGDYLALVRVNFDVKLVDPSYNVLLGPNTKVRFDSDEVTLIVDRGWAYLTGHWPRVKTKRLMAGTTGSSILAYHDDVLDIQRIFITHGTRSNINVLLTDFGDIDTTKSAILDDEHKFAEYNTLTTLVELKTNWTVPNDPLDPTITAQMFYDDVLHQAAAAGL